MWASKNSAGMPSQVTRKDDEQSLPETMQSRNFTAMQDLLSEEEELVRSIRLQYPKSSRLLLGTTTNIKQPGFLKALETKYPLELSLQCFDLMAPGGFFQRLTGVGQAALRPFAVFFYRTGGFSSPWEMIGRTETIQYDCMHRFVTKLKVCCASVEERRKELRVEVYDRRTKSDLIEDQLFIGGAQCSLEDIISESLLRKELLLESSRVLDPGMIVLSADAIRPSADGAKMYLNVDMASVTKGPHRVFYVLSRQLQSGDYTALYRSEVLAKTEKRFKPLIRDVGAITAGVEDKLIRLEVFQYSPKGRHIRLGFMQTSMDKLRKVRPNTSLLWWPATSCDGDNVIEIGRIVVIDAITHGRILKLRLRVTQ